jgi:hypothetical protein
MPRFRAEPREPEGIGPEFDLCSRCASDPDILRTVVAKKLGMSLERAQSAQFESLDHRSYDFLGTSVPCYSCARILTVEDD